MPFSRWVNINVDTDLFLQLQDLATVLADQPEFDFEYSYGSYIDVINNVITASTRWDVAQLHIKESGLKSDIFLRTIGTLYYSDVQALRSFQLSLLDDKLPRFSSQIMTLLEDIRLEEIIKKDRPGTVAIFELRRQYLKQYFESQLVVNATRSNPLDELFCLIYLLIQADQPDPLFPRANDRQVEQLDKLKPLIYTVFEARTTDDLINITWQIMERLEMYEQDSLNEYFIFPIMHIEKFMRNTLFDELTRTDPLANDDEEKLEEDKSEYIDEKFSTWHRESDSGDLDQTFLQFELEQGAKTSLLGDGARETEAGDQAMASIQGASGESKQQDYSDLTALEKEDKSKSNSTHESIFGTENKHAVEIVKNAETSSSENIAMYEKLVMEIDPFKRRLAKTIEKTLEHKKNEQRTELITGRLSKRLLPIVIDENPRVFYKKDNESQEIDAVFTLLVDCSASMHNKMDETKKGIILFHETLKTLKIPHEIVGFWEDAIEATKDYQPNYFHKVHQHTDSLYQNNGPKIMQLQPEEDNRDGFSIRVMTKDLMNRREKHKFLLIFSDGEPAATNYDQNGIIDTHEAVAEARKQGIDVIGMYLANGEIHENEDLTMKNIYDKQRLMIPSVAELPEYFAPLLKKLLLKAI